MENTSNRKQDLMNMLMTLWLILMVVQIAMQVSTSEKKYKQTKELLEVTKENTKTYTKLLNALGYFDIEKEGK